MIPDGRKISVALCTFNGDAFLAEQLASLKNQTRLPDELVVFDDGSTDGTVEQLQAFAAAAPFPVHLRINNQRLGPTKNFEQAIGACQGDIIALCDQDDIWLPHKLATIDSIFDKNPDLGFVFSDAGMCDQSGKDLGYRLWQSVGLTSPLRRAIAAGNAFQVILRQNIVTGATMAFASRFRPLLLPIDSSWMHDGWLAILLAAIAPVQFISEPLIRYRQHQQQAVGALRRSLYQQYLNAKKMDRDVFARHAGMYEAAARRLDQFRITGAANVSPDKLHLMHDKIAHLQKRSAIRTGASARLLPSLAELFTLRYRRFSLGWKSFAQDLFL